jgi:aspartokinase-like uncharacterized kinase
VVDAVVKVGGRLGREDGLRALCVQLAALGRRHRLLVVPGGGVFADAVRECDARFGLAPDAAHWMAILAMDQYGHLLGGLIPGSKLVRSMTGAAEVAGDGAVPVLLPHDLLRETDPLPHSWAVTSDSIAVWVAGWTGAPLLVLLKHGTALAALPEAASYEGEVPAATLAAAEAVDGAFAASLEGMDCEVWLLDGEEPQRLEALLETGRTEGVRVARGAP